MSRPASRSYETRTLILLGLAYGFAYYDRMMMTFLTPFIVPEFQLNNTQVGALGAALSLSWAIGAYVLGRWSDNLGVRKPFLLASLVIFSACSVLSGLATDFWTLFASRLLMGLVEGPFLPICLAIIAVVTPARRRGLNIGIVQNVFGAILGTAIAPIISVAIAEMWGWRYSFYTAALPGFILALLIWRYVAEPVESSPEAHTAQQTATGPGMLEMLRHRNIALCAVIGCLLVGSVVLGSIFLPLYLTQIRGFAPGHMATIMAILGLCPPIGGLLVPFLSDRIGRRLPMVIFGALMALTPLAALYFHGPPVMLTGLMFLGWIGLGTFPLFMGVIPAESLSGRGTAAAMGLVVAIAELTGGVVAPLGAGRLADAYGLQSPLLIALVMSLSAGMVALFLKETNTAAQDAAQPEM
ncbi:MFS transporter [Altericroceibacterium endophyticum]|uniref:MFS transporter n=1 Tax=Altericroceibacterium endophyticum TaxID=1808508 RepID=A0A6I4T9U4_9SPHN|nr:MFS transporter [Altericroceibacterium endophyticum]MXO67062.1 MFS transporter [Altericroceibacterium endophyticum]